MNVWNEKSKTDPRSVDFSRPWYAYAGQLISKAGMGEGKTAVDIGCGVGEFLQVLTNMGFKAKGLDASRISV